MRVIGAKWLKFFTNLRVPNDAARRAARQSRPGALLPGRGGLPGSLRIPPGRTRECPQRPPRRRRALSFAASVLAGALLAVFATVFAAPAHAQTNITLIDNTGQTHSSTAGSRIGTGVGGVRFSRGHQFTTGSNGAGYTLSQIRVGLLFGGIYSSGSPTPLLTVRENGVNERPGDLLYTFTNPSSFPTGSNLHTFTAPANAVLDAGTKYHVMLESSTSGHFNMTDTATNNVDAGGSAGWSIANNHWVRRTNNANWTSDADEVRFRITGSLNAADTDSTLSALALTDENGNSISLSPSFLLSRTSYNVSVENSIDELSVFATAGGASASIAYLDADDTAIADANTDAGHQVPLMTGVNTIKIEVEAEDGVTTRTYTLRVRRELPVSTTVSLVSNTGQSTSSSEYLGVGSHDKISTQGFNTGSHPAGYNLDWVGIYINDEDLESGEEVNVLIYTADSSGAKDTLVHTMVSPNNYTDDAVNVYRAPADATLDADTDYLVVFEGLASQGSDLRIGLTDANSEDAGRAAGWRIENARRRNDNLQSSGDAFMIAINGSAIRTFNNEATLSDLELSETDNTAIALSPGFDIDTISYTASVDNDADTINVIPTATVSVATIEYFDRLNAAIPDADTNTDGHQVALEVGDNTIKVKVTSQDATDEKTYTLVVTRDLPDTAGDTLISNTGKSQNAANALITAQAFTTGANATGYRLTAVGVALSTGSRADIRVRIFPESSSEPDDSAAAADIIELMDPPTLTANSVNLFTVPSNVNLAASTTYFVVVTDDAGSGSPDTNISRTNNDGQDSGAATGWGIGNDALTRSTSTDTWTTRGASARISITGFANPLTVSTDATLSALEVINANDNDVTLSPVFATGTTSYTASVGSAIDQITLNPTTGDGTASIEYLDGSDTAIADADTNAEGHQVLVHAGSNTVKLKITAGDGVTVQTYTLTVSRAQPSGSSIPSLVKNTGQTHIATAGSNVGTSGSNKHARGQRFDTGSETVGYRLTSVQVGMLFGGSFGSNAEPLVTIRENGNNDRPGALLYTLTNPSTFSNGLNTFDAPANATLDADSIYHLRVESTTGNFAVSRTNTGNEDSGAATGWSLSNTSFQRDTDTSSWTTNQNELRLNIRGVLASAASGAPAVTGAPQIGNDLGVDTSGITDTDGKTKAEAGDTGYAYSYQWLRVDDLNVETTITGETSDTYTLVDADVGHTIKVQVSFTDDADNAEGPLTSEGYPSTGTILGPPDDCVTDRAGSNWCALLTVGINVTGPATHFGFDRTTDYGDLDNGRFDHDGLTYRVEDIKITSFSFGDDQVVVLLNAFVPLGTVFNLGGMDFTADGASRATTTGLHNWSSARGSFAWFEGQKLTVSANIPNSATGQPEITGTPQVGQRLSAEKGTIADVDGTTGADNGDSGYEYSYQWVRVDGGTESDISGATGRNYTLSDDDEGKTLKVKTSFTDDGDSPEGPLTSDAYPSTGSVLAEQESCEDDRGDSNWCTTLTVEERPSVVPGITFYGFNESSGYGDLDDKTIDYSGLSYTIGELKIAAYDADDDDVFILLDEHILLQTVFDLGGTEFTADATSRFTAIGQHEWDAPANFAWIEGQFVTVSANLPPAFISAAADGASLVLGYSEDLDTSSVPAASAYGVSVDSATAVQPSSVAVAGSAVTLTLATAVTEGQTVTVSYTVPTSNPLQDESGLEAVALTDENASNNTVGAGGAPRILVPHTNGPRVGDSLEASKGTISDTDGVTNAEYSYQWIRVPAGGVDADITGATGDEYTLVAEDQGATIRVRAMFDDDAGNAETRTSLVTAAVLAAPNNGCAADTVRLRGGAIASEGSVEYCRNNEWRSTCDDMWDRQGADVACRMAGYPDGAKSNGATIESTFNSRTSVKFWLDDVECTGTETSLAQCSRAAWGVNNCHFSERAGVRCKVAEGNAEGQPEISGPAQVGTMLTATIGSIADMNGLPATFPDDYEFQWIRVDTSNNETEIEDAESHDYVPTSADVGNTLKVRVTYTDGVSTIETVTSDATYVVLPAADLSNCDPLTLWCATLTVGQTINSDNEVSTLGFVSADGIGSVSPSTFLYAGVQHTVTRLTVDPTAGVTLVTTPNLPLDGAGHTLHLQSFGGELDLPLADAMFTDSTNRWYFEKATLADTPTPLSEISLIRHFLRNDSFKTLTDAGTEVAVRISGTAPALSTAIVEDTSLVLTYDKPLDTGSVPAPSAFTVTVDGGAGAAPSSVAVNGSAVTLTLATAVSSGQAVTVSYSVPGTNPLQDQSGLKAVSLTNEDVTNVTAAFDGEYLVSNREVAASIGAQSLANWDLAQGFTTGPNPGGYLLAGVDLEITNSPTPSPTVTLHEHLPTNALLATLSGPATTSPLTSFEAPPGTVLKPDTRYVVRIEGGGAHIEFVRSFDEDPGGAPGWSIKDGLYERTFDSLSPFRLVGGLATERIGVRGVFITSSVNATGAPDISGPTQVSRRLTAGIGTIADADGLPSAGFPAGYEFQWIRVDSSNNESDITGATGSTYVLVDADLDHRIKVRVSFTDNGNSFESLTADATTLVEPFGDVGEPGELRLIDANGNVATDGVGRLEIFYRGLWSTGERSVECDAGDDADNDGFDDSSQRPCKGRTSGAYGTVCDDRFDSDTFLVQGRTVANFAPTLACQAMGFSDAEIIDNMPYRTDSTLANLPIWLDDVRCEEDGTHATTGLAQDRLGRCYHAGKGLHNCTHREDVALKCTGTFSNQQAAEPLTVEVNDVPQTHDGSAAFTFRLDFSEDVTISAADMRDHALTVTGATVTAAEQVDGRADLWALTIEPSGDANVVIVVEGKDNCTDDGALCTSLGFGLTNAVLKLVAYIPPPATSLTASFEAVPSEHDGSTEFTIELVFSEWLAEGTQSKLRRSLSVSGGTVTRVFAKQRQRDRWKIKVQPALSAATTITLAAGGDCASVPCTDGGDALSERASVTIQGPPGLSVADAEVEEAPDARLAFVITLDRAASGPVSVDVATSDGTATAGEDYVAKSKTVTFAAGVTAKTLRVRVLDDAHDESDETMTLTLSNPSGAYIDDGVATGTIRNNDHMPQAWLARFGRTVADQVIEAVEGRMTASQVPGTELSIGGQRIGGEAAPDDEALEAAETEAGLETLTAWLRDEEDDDALGFESRAVTARDALAGTSFALTEGSAEGGFGALWGRAAISRFDGRDDDLTLDGEVESALLGADWTLGRSAAGLVLSHSRGEGGYRSPAGNGAVESTLTGLYPWGRHALSESLSLWGIVGYGTGSLTLTPEGMAPIETDMDLTMAAVGLRSVLAEAPADGGLELAATSDAMVVQTTSDEVRGRGSLAASEADVTRLRIGLEGAWRGIGSIVPSFEIGLRQDGGDAETGFGADIGAGLAWSEPAQGIQAEVRARGLLTHEDSSFKERGFAGSFAWDPDPASDLGPSLTLRQTVGASATGGVDALLRPDSAQALIAANANEEDDLRNRRLETTLGYGISTFGGRYTTTPAIGFGLTEADREYVHSWRLAEAKSAGLVFGLDIEAVRRERVVGDAEPEHRFVFGLGWQLEGPRREGSAFEVRLEGARSDTANDNTGPETLIGIRLRTIW